MLRLCFCQKAVEILGVPLYKYMIIPLQNIIRKGCKILAVPFPCIVPIKGSLRAAGFLGFPRPYPLLAWEKHKPLPQVIGRVCRQEEGKGRLLPLQIL